MFCTCIYTPGTALGAFGSGIKGKSLEYFCVKYITCIVYNFPKQGKYGLELFSSRPQLDAIFGWGVGLGREGGGGLYIYLFMFTCGKNNSFKRNPSSRRRICEYAPPPPTPVIGEATAHILKFRKCAASLTCNQEIFNTYKDIYFNTLAADSCHISRGGMENPINGPTKKFPRKWLRLTPQLYNSI